MATKRRTDNVRIRKSDARVNRADWTASPVNNSSPTVLGVPISHPERLIYPDLGISKLELARYYERIGNWIAPHVTARPTSRFASQPHVNWPIV